MPPLPPDVHLRRPRRCRPFPLGEPSLRLHRRARHGLFRGLAALGLGPGDEILAPTYHHGSEIEAIARAGLVVRWYEPDALLEPDPDDLERLLRPATRALHLVHYLGFPQAVGRWRAWCDARGLRLIEDAAQAWLAEVDGRPVGSLGDLAIFSLYKTLGLPDGGAVVGRAESATPSAAGPLDLAGLARKHWAWGTGRVRRLDRVGPRRTGARPYDPIADFALGDPDEPASRATRYLLTRLADPRVAETRRRNYQHLLGALGEHVPPPFDRLPEGASPFGLPIISTDKPAALRVLAASGIRANDLWSVPHPLLPVADFPRTAERRGTTLLLPVHQELRSRDLARIVRAARAVTG